MTPDLRALIDEIEGALAPVAAMASGYHSFDGQHDYPDDFIVSGTRSGEFLSDQSSKSRWGGELYVGDLRAASKALAALRAAAKEGL